MHGLVDSTKFIVEMSKDPIDLFELVINMYPTQASVHLFFKSFRIFIINIKWTCLFR